MKLLLDAHALLWFLANDSQLSASARQNLEDPAHEKFVSIVTVGNRVEIEFGKIEVAESVQ